VKRLNRAPLALNSHFHAVTCVALVFLAQLAAVLIVAAASVLLVDPVLIISVVALMMLLRMERRRPECKKRNENWRNETWRSETWRSKNWRSKTWCNRTWCKGTSWNETGLHAVSPVLELSALSRARLPARRIMRSAQLQVLNSGSELRFPCFSIICCGRPTTITEDHMRI
jgi:hypothetical protein